MVTILSKYGIMYKKVNDKFLVVMRDAERNAMIQMPLHLQNATEYNKSLQPFYVDKDSQKVKDFVKENGYSFANGLEDLT